MKIASAVSLLVLAAAPALAQGPESAVVGAAKSFGALSSFRPAVSDGSVPGKPVEPAKPKAKAARSVVVSGPISLQGSAFVPNGGGWATATLSGWITVSDGSGVRSDSAYVTTTASIMANGGWVNATVWPNAYVSLYKDGRLVGQVNVSGTVFVSGYASGGWVNLGGSGTLTGSTVINEP